MAVEQMTRRKEEILGETGLGDRVEVRGEGDESVQDDVFFCLECW